MRLREKAEFLEAQIEGLKARMVSGGNAIQRERIAMWQDILSDYVRSLEKANGKDEGKKA